jgi:hypothetical protein
MPLGGRARENRRHGPARNGAPGRPENDRDVRGVRHDIFVIAVWGCLTVAGLLLAGCSFEPGGNSSSNPGSDAAGGGNPADARPVPDGAPAAFDAAPPADAPPPPELLETLTVQATGEVETSNTLLELGASYILIAAGTVAVRDDGYSGDADYWWSDEFGFGGDTTGEVDLGLAINDIVVDSSRSPDWGDYSSGHSYQVTMEGTGAVLTAQYHDPNFENNSGSLTLEIYGPP